jgi:nucleotide-binding universal stress UspA family protein
MVFRDILVPVAGTPASRGAQEVAFGLAAARRGRVTVLHVLTRQRRAGGGARRPDDEAGRGILADAARFALRHGATVRTRTRRGPSPGEEIVRLAAETDVDVIVLGAVARSLDGRPFLGHTVEHVLEHARAAVVVVVLPSDLPSSSSEADHSATDEATDAGAPPNGAQRSGSGPG